MPKVSYKQSVQIAAWLEDGGFQKEEKPSGVGGLEGLWVRAWDDCLVRLARQGGGVRVEVCHGGTSTGWRGLDELVGLRAAWPEARTMSPIELATTPQLHPHSQRSAFRRSPGGWLYRNCKPWAYSVKILLQMLVGLGALIDIGMHVANSVANQTGAAPLAPPTVTTVRVIAYALAVAAAIELAYTLYTPGPDEALDPLMLGLSSGILILITSDNHLSVTDKYWGILIGVFALAGLFLVRKYLLSEDDQ
jgi:hypothetical protein